LSGLSAVGLPIDGELPIQTWRFESGDLYTEVDAPTDLGYYTIRTQMILSTLSLGKMIRMLRMHWNLQSDGICHKIFAFCPEISLNEHLYRCLYPNYGDVLVK
jgi:hypothetical protein